jgi:hypothetical protein
MKKYVSPELDFVKAETMDIMVGSDVIIDITNLFDE